MPTETTYRVLARKYRPQNFLDLIGQEAMVRTLTNAFETGRIAQAWMLAGIRGIGKTTTARILARALNYKTKDIDRPTTALNELGEHCTQIIEGRHIDVIEMDAASHTGIDDIREIIEQTRYRPVSARYKIYIIDEVHMLSTQAFNGLLKTLEEPPPHVKFIFATTEIRKVPITILSRCQRFDLRRVEPAVLVNHLRKISQYEDIETDDQALAIIARAAGGSVRDALSILDQAIAHGNGQISTTAVRTMLGLSDQTRIIDLFEYVMKGDVITALHELRSQYDAGADPFTILTDLADFNHLVTRLHLIPDTTTDLPLTESERLRSLDFSKKLSIRILSRSWQMLLKGIQEISQVTHPLQAAEMLLIRLTHVADLPTLDEALKKLNHDQQNLPMAQSHSCEGNSHSDESSKSKTAKMTDILEKTELSQVPEDISFSQETDIPKNPPRVTSLRDIVALSDLNHDIPFKVLIKEFVHPVSFEPNHITLRLTENAPSSLARDIKNRLEKWTGKQWTITLVDKGGGQTLQEEEAAVRDSLFAKAQTHPDVKKVLSHFPGSRIVDVRFNKQESDPDLHSRDLKVVDRK